MALTAIVFSVENHSVRTEPSSTAVLQTHCSFDVVAPTVVAWDNFELPVIDNNPLLLLSAEEKTVVGTVPTVLPASNSPPAFIG